MSAIATRITALPREAQLRLALKLDAVVTGANGAAYFALAGPLEDLLAWTPRCCAGSARSSWPSPPSWRTWPRGPRFPGAGHRRDRGERALGDRLRGLRRGGLSSPETAGTVWTLMQAAVVAGFAGLQARLR